MRGENSIMKALVTALTAVTFLSPVFYGTVGLILSLIVHKNTDIRKVIKKILITQAAFLSLIMALGAVYGGLSAAATLLFKGKISINTMKRIIMCITWTATYLILPVYTSVAASVLTARSRQKRYYITGSARVLVLEIINLAFGTAVNEITAASAESTSGIIVKGIIYTATGLFDMIIILKIYGFFDGTRYDRFFGRKTGRAVTSVMLCLCLAAPVLTPSAMTVQASAGPVKRKADTGKIQAEFQTDNDRAEMTSAGNASEKLPKNPSGYYKQAEPEGELVAANDTSRTYRTGEKTYVTMIAGTASEYENSDGTYSRIDNTLVRKNGSYQNRANDYKVKLPAEISEGKGITVCRDGKKSIELIPSGGDFTRSRTSDNAILYSSVYDGIDYQYTVLENKIKEDIILNRHTDRDTFRFIIKAAGYNVILKNNAVLIYEDDEKTPVYTIAAPVMTDASGEACFDINLAMENSDISSGYVITMTANSQWLAAAERAYPVRIDPTITIDSDCIGLYCVEQGSENSVIGDNNFPYSGYDDGETSGNLGLYGQAHLMTRTYVSLDYDFSQISTEADISHASFDIYQYTGWSGGETNFCLYTADESWDGSSLTWASQTDMSHTYVSMCQACDGAGWLNFDITDTINDWVQGLSDNNGFVIKAEDERNMQAEVFHNRNGSNPPQISIEWSIPDPVDTDYPLDETTINLRPMTEKSMDGQLQFDAVFADGTASPGADVNYCLTPETEAESSGTAIAGMSYRYPDNTMYNEQLPAATKYKSKDSNWQSILFSAMMYDTSYKVKAHAVLAGRTGKESSSDSFVIYKIKQTDTLPYIADYYGVGLDQLMRDNKVSDTLLVENNTIFIRNPQTEEPYSPEEPDEDAKKAIDSALMGRGFHCEYGYEPVNLNTGNFILEAQDASVTEYNSEFTIDRTYNAKRSGNSSLFGRGWSFSYDEKLGKKADGSITYSTGDGKILYFKPDGNGGYTSPDNYNYIITLEPYTQDEETLIKYRITDSDGSFKVFNAWGLAESITDAYGKTTEISYDDKYQINRITSAYDNSYIISHDGYGRISSITLPNGAVTEYRYDDGGNLVEYRDANGNVIRYEYDSHHRITEWYDQDNTRIITNVYDDNDRVTSQTDADGNIVTFTYSEGETRTTDSNGNITIYNYDEYYRTAKVTYSYGRTEEYSYDASGNLSSDSDYSYTYDNNGNLLSKTRKDGRSVNYAYNGRNQITQYTDYSGNKTSYSYDTSGNLTEIIYADGSKTAYEYDELNRLVKETGQDGNTVIRSYTGALVSSCTDADGNTASYSYNSMGKLITLTDAAGNITRYMWDKAGNQTGTQAPDGGFTEYTLNKSGNVTAVTDALGYRTDFEYDGNRNIIKATDPEGNAVTCTYDGNGNKLDSTDAEGNKTIYMYDAGNRLVKMVTADGAVTADTYNTEGLLTKITDTYGRQTCYEYDTSLKKVIKETDADGNVTGYSYDADGRLTQITYPDGLSKTFIYDKTGKVIRTTQENGLEILYAYDKAGRLTKKTINNESTYTYEYDNNGNLISETDPEGNRTSYTYDVCNRQNSCTDAAGNKTAYAYDSNGNLLAVMDASGNSKSYTYDKNGNVITATDANGGVKHFAYNKTGLLISEKDAEGNVTNYAYNGNGKLISAENAVKAVTEYSYDKMGNLVSVTDALDNEYRLAYDALNNLTDVKLPDNSSVKYEYDTLNHLVKITDTLGLITQYTYDARGRLTEEKDNAGTDNRYSYDSYGVLESRENAIGQREEYKTDIYGRTIQIKGSDGNISDYTYDKNGKVTSVTSAQITTEYIYDAVGNVEKEIRNTGDSHTYTYDALGRVLTDTDALSQKVSYQYDANGNVTARTDGNGITVSYTYDKNNRAGTYTDGNGNTTEYNYSAAGQLTSVKDAAGNTTEYLYDKAGRLSKVKDARGNVTEKQYDSIGNLVKDISAKGYEETYTYDAHGNITSYTDAMGSETGYTYNLHDMLTARTQADGSSYSYEYDKLDRLTKATSPDGNTIQYSYDNHGNVSGTTDTLNRTTDYKYDDNHNIIQITDALGRKTSYTYDKQGNLTQAEYANDSKSVYTYDVTGKLVSSTSPDLVSVNLAYDKAGNITSVEKSGGRKTSYTYDNNYNVTSVTDPEGNVTKNTYDTLNRITSVTDADGNITEYAYDKTGNVTGIKRADSETSYAYDASGNVVEEVLSKVTDKSGVSADSVKYRKSYTYDRNNRLIQVINGESTASYEYDKMGNITSQTDAAGNTTQFTYDSEGNLTSVSDSAGNTTSYEYDTAARLIKCVRPDGQNIKYDYDVLDEMLSKSCTDGTQVEYAYDVMGKRISMKDHTGETGYTTDKAGNITSVTQLGKKTEYTYDECARLSEITYPDGTGVTYEYDLNDHLIKVTDNGETTQYTYDKTGNVIKTERSSGINTEYTYDEQSRLTKLVNSKDGEILSSFEYSYDIAGNVISEDAVSPETSAHMDYEYDNSGQLIKYTRITDSSNEEYTYTYDKSGNITGLVKTGVEQPETIEYTYNSSNQLVSSVSSISGKTDYSYDANGSLISKINVSDTYTYEYTTDLKLKAVKEGGSLLMAASYDGDGNRIFTATKTESVHKYPETENNPSGITIESGSVGGDEEKDQTEDTDITGGSDSESLDFAGTTEEKGKTYAGISDMFWYGFSLGIIETSAGVNAAPAMHMADSFNRKWDEQTENTGKGGTSAGSKTASSTSDSACVNGFLELQGIIIPDTTDTDNGNGTYTTTEYASAYYVNNINTENAQVLMTYESLASDTPSAVYTYGNERISVKDTEGKDTASSYYLYDGRGSVAQLADNTGVTRTLTYDPYGEITGGAKEYESLYGYNAEEYNTVTGLTYLRYRYLDNETGRFTQEDNYLGSIIEAVSLNRYTYANNNPVMYADPSGHWPKMSSIGKSLARNASKIGAVAGMVVGAAIATAVIIATAPVSVPVLATAAIAVGAVTVSAAIGGSIGNEIEKRQNQKDYADITNEQEDVTRQLEEYCSGEENIHNAETQQQISRLEQRRTQIEKKKKNICEKTAKIKKQEDIYTNLGYAGIGLIALGLAPVSGPAMAGELGLGTAKIAGTVAVSDAATVGAATAGALGTTYHSSNIIGAATGTNPVESYIYNGDTESFREDTALLDNINMTSSAYGIIGAGSKTGEEAVENLGERYDWGSESGTSSVKTDFYVKPNGEIVPATGYRYMPAEASYMESLKNTMEIPANPSGTYITFDKFDVPTPGRLQVPHDASIRGSFDTLQIIDDIRVPNGKWGQASWLEPITKDFPKYGPGGATQALTYQKIKLNSLKDLSR